jgi:hypothetical protein
MSDASLSITNNRTQRTKTFEANSTRLETTTLGINFDKSNDYSVPLNVCQGVTIYLRPDQVDAIRMSALGAGRPEFDSEGNERPRTGISVSVGGRTYNVPAAEIHRQLSGRGALT